jgi:hypothetical protein
MTDRELMRHALAVLAYRGGKPLRGAKPEFATFDTGGGHTPLLILSHLGDLLDWALGHLRGEPKWVSAPLATWDEQVPRFFASLAAVDAYLASDEPVRCDLRRLLAGPIADALTHVGQLMMLRRMSGDPVYGENYFVAEILTGRVGIEQSPPVRPF